MSVFYQAISEYGGTNDLAYDLGCGSGILSYFLSSNFNEIISLEIDSSAYKCAKENLSNFDNVKVINADVLEYEFDRKADLIVCEMMDTALIDEEQIPVLNHARKCLEPEGKIIPQAIFNSAELVNLEREYIHWDENARYEVFSDALIYSEFDFMEDIDPNFETTLSLKVKRDGTVNGLKITNRQESREDGDTK